MDQLGIAPIRNGLRHIIGGRRLTGINLREKKPMLEELHISLPADAKSLSTLKLGSVVYLDGIVYTAREGVYHQVLEEGDSLPDGLSPISNANFHCSPAAAVNDSLPSTAARRFPPLLPGVQVLSTQRCLRVKS